MRIVKYELGKGCGTDGCVLALGFFDGVHLGHRKLIDSAVSEAGRRGVLSAVFTFAYGGALKDGAAMIYSEGERERLLSLAGIDVCIVGDFEELRGLSPEDFIKGTVVSDIGADLVVAGYDYRFGHLGSGDTKSLSEFMRKEGKDALIFDAVMQDGKPVSSTRVRTCLENGDIKKANRMLGLPYFLTGTVEHGRGDGRCLGYPTLNIPVPKGRAMPRRGVYLTAAKIGGKLYTGLTNAGECPTFGKREYHTETHVLDFCEDIYGREAELYFLDFIREERDFFSKEELKEQIKKDCDTARGLKEKIKWQEFGLA